MKNSSKKGFLLVKIDFAFLPTTFIVYRVLVHYRVGSLEKGKILVQKRLKVHYRVGSLEIELQLLKLQNTVHYRVGGFFMPVIRPLSR